MSPYSSTMVFLAASGFLASILAMLALAPWYRTATGRILFLVKLATFLVLLLIALRVATDLEDGLWWIEIGRAIAYTGAAVAGWGVTAVIVRAQMKNRSSIEKELWTKDPQKKEWESADRRSTADQKKE